MRMVEAEQLFAARRGLRLRIAVILGTNTKASSRTFFGRVWQRVRTGHHAAATDKRATALIGVRLDAVLANGGFDTLLQR